MARLRGVRKPFLPNLRNMDPREAIPHIERALEELASRSYADVKEVESQVTGLIQVESDFTAALSDALPTGTPYTSLAEITMTTAGGTVIMIYSCEAIWTSTPINPGWYLYPQYSTDGGSNWTTIGSLPAEQYLMTTYHKPRSGVRSHTAPTGSTKYRIAGKADSASKTKVCESSLVVMEIN